MAASVPGELGALAAIARLLGQPPRGETWMGDDAAVISVTGPDLLFATDVCVEDVHFTRAFCALDDIGWKALAVNVSDIAAMGGRSIAATVGVVGASTSELQAIYSGLVEASTQYHCPVVGGDLSAGSALVISVVLIGAPSSSSAVLRSGARPGDHIFVTGSLGGSAAGLRELRADPTATGPLIEAYRRPVARAEEGVAAAAAGASAMIDVSDGLGIDIDRLATASGVGVRLDEIPVATGATLEEALGGGEDYELIFTAASWALIEDAFGEAELAPPLRIGEIVADPTARTYRGQPLLATGYVHQLS